MKKLERYKFLQLFGDGNCHSWYNIVFLGVNFLKIHQRVFEEIFKRALDAGLVLRVKTDAIRKLMAEKENHKTGIWVGPDWRHYDYVISMRGEECLRSEQIQRHGDASYYRYFDRTISGANGLDKYAPLPKGMKPL